MPFLSGVLPAVTQHSSGQTWRGAGGRGDQQIHSCWAVKEMIGVVGEGTESGQILQQILSWGFPP